MLEAILFFLCSTILYFLARVEEPPAGGGFLLCRHIVLYTVAAGFVFMHVSVLAYSNILQGFQTVDNLALSCKRNMANVFVFF